MVPTKARAVLKSALTSRVPHVRPLRVEPLAEEQVGQDVLVGGEAGEAVVGGRLVVVEGEAAVGAILADLERAVTVVSCAGVDVASDGVLVDVVDVGAARTAGAEQPGLVRLISSKRRSGAEGCLGSKYSGRSWSCQ